MDLVNELGNELALAFLVEKKHAEKLNSTDALALIDKVKETLEPVSNFRETDKITLPVAENIKTAVH